MSCLFNTCSFWPLKNPILIQNISLILNSCLYFLTFQKQWFSTLFCKIFHRFPKGTCNCVERRILENEDVIILPLLSNSFWFLLCSVSVLTFFQVALLLPRSHIEPLLRLKKFCVYYIGHYTIPQCTTQCKNSHSGPFFGIDKQNKWTLFDSIWS